VDRNVVVRRDRILHREFGRVVKVATPPSRIQWSCNALASPRTSTELVFTMDRMMLWCAQSAKGILMFDEFLISENCTLLMLMPHHMM
jgi:hypothetical protein